MRSFGLGLFTYGKAIDPVGEMRAKGMQRLLIGTPRHNGSLRGGGTQFYGGYIRPQHAGQAVQSMLGSARRMGEKTPWYEAFFSHIERIAPVATAFVLQLQDARYDQQRYAWQQASQDKRDAAYQEMMKSIVSAQTGQGGTMDPRAQSFIYDQFRSESRGTRNALYDQVSGGDPTVAAALRNLLEPTPWYKNPLTWVALAGAAGLGIALFFVVSAQR